MLVVCDGDEFRPDESLLGHELDLAGVLEELWSEQDRDVFDVFASVARGVLAIEVGVDRHLRDAASTDGVDEVDGCGATFASNGIQC